MAKINKMIPGQIKVRTTAAGNQYIYVKFTGDTKFTATGLIHSRENILIAEKALKQAYLEENKKESNNNEQNFYEQYEQFINFKILRGISKKSIWLYNNVKKIFFPENFNLNEIINLNGKKMYKIEYLVYLKLLELKSTMAASSLNTYIVTIQGFCNYAYEEEIIDKLIKFKKYYFETESKDIKIYTDDELKTIFWSILKSKYRNKKFLAYWFLFLLYTGSRKMESTYLTWDNIDFENREIKFPNKIRKKKYNYFPISTKLLKLLYILKAESLKRKKRSNYLFPISGEGLTIAMKDVLEKLHIKQPGKLIHSFRKTYVTKLYDLRDQMKLDGEVIIELSRHTDKKLTDEFYRQRRTKYIIHQLDNAGE